MLTSVLRIKLCLVGAARTAPGRCAVGAHAVAVLAAARTSRANPSEAAGSRGWPLAARAIPVRPARVPRAGNPPIPRFALQGEPAARAQRCALRIPRFALVSPGATEFAPTAQRPGAVSSTGVSVENSTRLAAHCLVFRHHDRAGEGVLLLNLIFQESSGCSGGGVRGGWAWGALSVAPGETRKDRVPGCGTQAGRAGIARIASGHPCEPVASEGFAREVRAQRGPQRHARPGPSPHAPRKNSTTQPPHHPA